MSKIFRLHSGASQNIEHWQQIGGHLTDNFINAIEDPAGANINTQITSIPSPFARMDLFRTSFRFVNSSKNLNQKTIYHRMVSECLDVAEIFYNIEGLKDKIEILEWNSGIFMNGGRLDIDVNSDLGKLLTSSKPKQKLLGETLKMFLFQDANAFNFHKLKHIYLLNHKRGSEEFNIIGGTSPATMFFSSANDLSFVDITFTNHKMFDRNLCPLMDRGAAFIKYIYSLKKAYNNLYEDFPDFNNYLDLTFEQLSDSLKSEIQNFDADTYANSYININIKTETNNAEILGFRLLAKNYLDVSPEKGNVFLIANTKEYTGKVPCALPIDVFNEEVAYADGVWRRNFHENVPITDKRPLELRTLPNQTTIYYPYITIGDLLEPYIIKLPYPIDSKSFFDGNYTIRQGEKDHGYILPLKKLYFEFFSIKDLQGTVGDGRKCIEISQTPSGIKVTLRVPIQENKYVQYSRLYNFNKFQDRIQQADDKENIGIIIENQMTLAIYPFVKVPETINPHYRILCVDRDVAASTINLKYNLSFYKDSNPKTSISVLQEKNRSSKHQSHGATTNYSIVEENFDFIEVSHNNATGIIMPLFKDIATPAHTFKFAIDFGTTNTHIEYKSTIQQSAKPFDITENDVQFATLHEPGANTERSFTNPKYDGTIGRLTLIINEEFLPRIIGKHVQHKFPQRTVINDNSNFNANEATFALADFNIPFWYLKEHNKLNSEITSNLKWSDFRTNRKLERRTKAFLKQLMLMIRNKVLLNNGDISKTEIIWFYPSSMPTFRKNFLKEAWETYYKRYFNGVDKLHSMSESLAPFYYFNQNLGVLAGAHPVLSIDVGGGTSDAVVYKNNEPALLTSFRFASNALFGDGYGNTSATNGFVLKYEKEIRECLNNTLANKLMEIYDDIKSKNLKSLELIEFFFSLEENKTVTDNLPISFSKILSDDTEFKIIFLLYYAAIIYHISKLMHLKGFEVPRYITFSGNGAKAIKAISQDSNFINLAKFTKIIFNDSYHDNVDYNIELKLVDNPKEITCKGGLACTNFTTINSNEEDIKAVLIGNIENNVIPETSLHYSKIRENTVVDSVVKEYNTFIDKFFAWNDKINYYNTFGISPASFEKYKEYLKEDTKSYLIAGMDEKLKENKDNININIEETLFFYPLNGALNKLTYKIYTDNNI